MNDNPLFIDLGGESRDLYVCLITQAATGKLGLASTANWKRTSETRSRTKFAEVIPQISRSPKLHGALIHLTPTTLSRRRRQRQTVTPFFFDNRKERRIKSRNHGWCHSPGRRCKKPSLSLNTCLFPSPLCCYAFLSCDTEKKESLTNRLLPALASVVYVRRNAHENEKESRCNDVWGVLKVVKKMCSRAMLCFDIDYIFWERDCVQTEGKRQIIADCRLEEDT
jgi:hypothetical protein